MSKLLGSGVLASIGFVFLSSGRFFHLDRNISVAILLFIQFQMIGLTIAKYGVDNLVFAKLLANDKVIYNPMLYLKSKGIFLVIACAIVYAIFCDYRYAILILITIALDVYSTISIVQMSAKGDITYSLFTNIAAYPLFFLFLYLSSLFFIYDSFIIAILPFCACIFLRFVFSKYYIYTQSKKEHNDVVSVKVPLGMGLQQILNYQLFKTDQIVITLGTFTIVQLKLSNNDIQQILFLSKFPELVSGVLLSLSILYAPILTIDNKEKYIFLLKKYALLFILYSILLFVALIVYTKLWKYGAENSISYSMIIAYFFSALLIIIVNMITLGFLKTEKLKSIKRNLIISCLIGLGYICVSFAFNLGKYYVYVVAIQLFVFAVLPLINKSRDEVF